MVTKLLAFVIALAGVSLLGAASAQVTNCCAVLPATKLEAMETNLNTVIVRGSSQIGVLSVGNLTIAVKCRELTDGGSGRREEGVAIEIQENGRTEDTALIDYDELSGLLTGMDVINKLDWSVTTLTDFNAAFTTKGGFRVVVFGSRRTGTTEFAIRFVHSGRGPVLLSRDLVSQIRSLIDQAKAKLDSLRK
jgi:hypothetical protein